MEKQLTTCYYQFLQLLGTAPIYNYHTSIKSIHFLCGLRLRCCSQLRTLLSDHLPGLLLSCIVYKYITFLHFTMNSAR